jgi:nicotinamide phosphoribosyltransferase
MNNNTNEVQAVSRAARRAFSRKTVSWILKADSYKHSHKPQYAPGITAMMAYGSARSSKIRQISSTQFFGMEAFVKEVLLKPITHADIDYAKERIAKHGNGAIFFAEADFRKIVDKYEGYVPVVIKAVKEGTNVPIGEVQYTVESDDPDLFWMVQFIETVLLRGVWYPTAVSTISKACKRIIWKYLLETCDNPAAEIPFKLHDFGARGVSSNESAELGGMAHLVNFMGTDTVTALEAALDYYGEDMAGFSLNASEHATITSWKRELEYKAYENMIDQFGKPGAIFACVSDSYDIFKAVEEGWGTVLKQKVIDSGAILVVRPDSGDPISTVVKVVTSLSEKFGYTVNKKGYKVLNNVRVIQGDGIDLDMIESILMALKLNQFSAENVAFGMGGALLQKVDRDTFSFAQKCSAVRIGGEWKDVFKEAPGKKSLKGRVVLVKGMIKELTRGAYGDVKSLVTIRAEEAATLGLENQLELVFKNGVLVREQTLDEIRSIAKL